MINIEPTIERVSHEFGSGCDPEVSIISSYVVPSTVLAEAKIRSDLLHQLCDTLGAFTESKAFLETTQKVRISLEPRVSMNESDDAGRFCLLVPRSYNPRMHDDHYASQSLRQRLHEIIFETDTPAGRGFDNALLFCVAASVVVVMLESVAEVQAQYG